MHLIPIVLFVGSFFCSTDTMTSEHPISFTTKHGASIIMSTNYEPTRDQAHVPIDFQVELLCLLQGLIQVCEVHLIPGHPVCMKYPHALKFRICIQNDAIFQKAIRFPNQHFLAFIGQIWEVRTILRGPNLKACVVRV